MKRKIAAILTIALLTTTLFSGCGSQAESNSGSSDVSGDRSSDVSSDKNGTTSSQEFVFSKLFENDVIIYQCGYGEGGHFEGKEESIDHTRICRADGSFYLIDGGGDLGELAQMDDEEIIQKKSEHANTKGNYKLGIVTDDTGNNTATECVLVQATYSNQWENSKEEGWIGYVGGTGGIGNFVGHIEVYDSSYMMFQKSGNYDSTIIYLIRDTEETKDKTIVFDAVGTDGIVVDKKAEEAFE